MFKKLLSEVQNIIASRQNMLGKQGNDESFIRGQGVLEFC